MTKQQLIEDNMKLVYSLIRKEYPTYIGDEDLVQSGMLGLCQAAEQYDPSRTKFSTFAYICIRNAIRNELKSRTKHQGILSLDYEIKGDGGTTTFGDTIVGDEDVIYVEVNTELLTDREKQILELFQTGLCQTDIAKQLRISCQAVWTAMRKIRIKNDKKRG